MYIPYVYMYTSISVLSWFNNRITVHVFSECQWYIF